MFFNFFNFWEGKFYVRVGRVMGISYCGYFFKMVERVVEDLGGVIREVFVWGR